MSEGNKVRVIHCEDENIESREIAANISEFIKSGNASIQIWLYFTVQTHSHEYWKLACCGKEYLTQL